MPFDLLYYPAPSCLYNSRGALKPMAIVIHCLGYEKATTCLTQLNHPKNNVSAHYFVPQVSGERLCEDMPNAFSVHSLRYPKSVPVICLVDDQHRAWHAGKSTWSDWNQQEGCSLSLNSCTLGIEFHAPGYKGAGFYDFPRYTQGQIKTGISLIKALMEKHAMPRHHLVGHSDISWDREPLPRTDPGLFFWKELAECGLGYMPPSLPHRPSSFCLDQKTVAEMQKSLIKIGYRGCPVNGSVCLKTLRAINAYRMHFLPTDWTGPNAPPSPALLESLLSFEGNYALGY